MIRTISWFSATITTIHSNNVTTTTITTTTSSNNNNTKTTIATTTFSITPLPPPCRLLLHLALLHPLALAISPPINNRPTSSTTICNGNRCTSNINNNKIKEGTIMHGTTNNHNRNRNILAITSRGALIDRRRLPARLLYRRV